MSSAALLFPLSMTSPVFADDPAPCVAPSSTSPGVHWPTGSDASTFTYQCTGQYAGMWTNTYYAYDPATSTRIALYPIVYTYNSTTGMWDYTSWDFNATNNTYQADTLSVKTPPTGATTKGGPSPVTDTSTDSAGSPNSLTSPTTGTTTPSSGSPSSSGGSGINTSGTFNTALNNNTGAVMSNFIVSGAGSGDAAVIGNTSGGDATTGAAQVIASVINMLQSSSNILASPNLITFTANINGDVNGDLMLNPAQLGTVQPANTSTSLDNNVTINNSLDTSLNNNVNLAADSGNAKIANNTSGGNATSGTADAVANIVNILNSAVTAGKSFMGVININGNLNGDILLPPNFVDQLLASNVPRYTVNTANLKTNVNVNNTDNSAINNAVTASASSGNASVTNNTSGGNALTGLANTNLTVFNLTGDNLVASNDLLVFVNVLGTWYGMIMNAPAGTTAASLGGGVSSNTTVNNNATLNNTANQSINNNIKVAADSGNANVTGNTAGGNATSGNANASVNIMNMINDSLSLNGWFGLLFINVFGTWNGSFGINTSAGDPVVASSAPTGSSGSGPMFQFVPVSTVAGASNRDTLAASAASNSSPSNSGDSGSVLASKTSKGGTTPSTSSTTPAQKATNHYVLPAIGAAFAFLILFAGERKRVTSRV